MSNASRAETCSPERIMSMPRLRPTDLRMGAITMRGRRPTLISGRPKTASSEAMTMSQPAARPQPPASAKPCTLATRGVVMRAMASGGSGSPRRRRRPPSRAASRTSRLLPAPLDHIEELLEDAGRRAPDDVLDGHREEVNGVRCPLTLPELGAEDVRIPKRLEGHLQHSLDLPAIGLELHVAGDDPDDRCDDERRRARRGIVEESQHLDGVRRQPDLLPRLSQARL